MKYNPQSVLHVLSQIDLVMNEGGHLLEFIRNGMAFNKGP